MFGDVMMGIPHEHFDHELRAVKASGNMVFGNMGPTSGTGVCFTRNPNTGDPALYGEYLINAKGEDGSLPEHFLSLDIL